MKWYLASRMRHSIVMNELSSSLKSQGEEIVYQWSSMGSLKPYSDNAKKSSSIANDISNSIVQADIFVLISDEAGTDMFIELGLAISHWMSDSTVKIYVVGKYNDRSLMHFHPAIKRVKSFNDILEVECSNIVNEKYKVIE